MADVSPEINVAYPDYLWYPDVLVNVTNSVEKLSADYYKHRQESPGGDMASFVRSLAANGLGIHDISSAEVAQLVDHPENTPYSLADMISRRAQTGWSTHGHSGTSSLCSHAWLTD
jgi:alkaline phosphatase